MVWATNHSIKLGKQPKYWVIPKRVQTKLIQYVHKQEHFKTKNLLSTLKIQAGGLPWKKR